MTGTEEPTEVLVARLLDDEARQRAPDIRRPARQPRARNTDHGVIPPPRREGERNQPLRSA
jgi:hypothetical protein